MNQNDSKSKLRGKPWDIIPFGGANNFGNNEFSVKREFSITHKNTNPEFLITDYRYDTHWIKFPTKGDKKLSSKATYQVNINEEGKFEIIKIVIEHTVYN